VSVKGLIPMCCILALALGAAGSVGADEPPPTYDRIQLSASATTEVDNDLLVAVLYEQREGKDPVALADQVSRAVRAALKRAKQAPDIKVQTLDYRTTPVYSKQAMTGWRVRQSIRLEGRNAARIGQLISELQSDLQVASVGYQISPQVRSAAEDRLIQEAIGAFSRRAQLVAVGMGRPGYRLVEMSIQTQGRVAPRPMAMRAMAAEMAPAPPMLEPGTQEVRVEVIGTVELKVIE
jgi:predicted secreted protein